MSNHKILVNIVSQYDIVKKNPKYNYDLIDNFCSQYDYNFSVATQQHNLCRNRYSDVLANDTHRFVSKNIEYINADVYDQGVNRKYILSQGPIKQHMHDFLSMIVDSSTSTIVCLCNHKEGSKLKYDIYFDDTRELIFNQFRVKVTTIIKKSHATIRILCITKNNIEYFVNHIHYPHWPDHGVPVNVKYFFNMYSEIKQDNRPLLVHCSAGIGRTGSFVVISELLELIKLGNYDINVISTIVKIRKFRAKIVQNAEQLLFCYRIVIEYLRNGLGNGLENGHSHHVVPYLMDHHQT